MLKAIFVFLLWSAHLKGPFHTFFLNKKSSVFIVQVSRYFILKNQRAFDSHDMTMLHVFKASLFISEQVNISHLL